MWPRGLRIWHWHCSGSGHGCAEGLIPGPKNFHTLRAQPKRERERERGPFPKLIPHLEPFRDFDVCGLWGPVHSTLMATKKIQNVKARPADFLAKEQGCAGQSILPCLPGPGSMSHQRRGVSWKDHMRPGQVKSGGTPSCAQRPKSHPEGGGRAELGLCVQQVRRSTGGDRR